MNARSTLAVVARPDAAERLQLIRSIAAAELLPTWSFDDLPSLLGSDAVLADSIVVLQSWPDEYTSRQVHSLLAAAPLSRLILATGPWCAGDGRTRNIWPAGVRVPITELTSRLTTSPAQRLAWTASRTEVFEFNYAANNRVRDCLTVAVRPRRVAVCVGGDRCYAAVLAGVLFRRGHHVVSDPADADVVIFDADLLPRETFPHQSGLIALASIPSQSMSRKLRAAGCPEVVWKMSPVSTLIAAVDAA